MKTSIAEIEVQHDTVQKERELEKKKANQKLLIWILSLVCVMLILGAFFFNKIRTKNSQLANQKQELEKTVGEKNTLLKETHHRVKNSFQIVSGLLFLKSSTIKDKSASKALTETQNRINSMAVLHQKLYKKDYTSGIDCYDYITDLVSDILSSYSNPHIDKKLDIEAVTLNIDVVTSLGLIINELVTNSLKYAFTDDITNPYIEIKLYTLKNNMVLSVVDNGVGFSEKEQDEETLGLSLVKDLVKKINATITFENLQNHMPNGTRITILINDYKLQV
jgi:two-component sensor histidine kinase